MPLSMNNEMEYVVDSRLLRRVDATRLRNTDHWSMDTINDGWEDDTDEADDQTDESFGPCG